MSVQVLDSQARQQALDHTRSFITQAPAGSGKTELLTQRILKLLAHCQEPENVLSITFTRKAAGEMRHRVLSALKLASLPDCPTQEPEKTTYQLGRAVLKRSNEMNWDLESNPGRLQIFTIDSLCSAIAKTSPVTNSFGVLPSVTDSPMLLYKKAAMLTLKTLDSDDTELVSAISKVLVHLDNDMPKLESLLITMLEKRQQWMQFIVPMSQESGAKDYLESALSHQIQSVLQETLSHVSSDFVQRMKSVMELLNQHAQAMGDDPLYPVETEVQVWQSAVNLFLTGSSPFSYRKKYTKASAVYTPNSAPSGMKEAFELAKIQAQELLQEASTNEDLRKQLLKVKHIPSPSYTDEQWAVIESLITLLIRAVVELKLVFAEQSESDFVEMSELALRSLGASDSPSDIALSLDHRIQHILVDEFQDTSMTQFNLLKLLTSGWEEDDGRTLFLVGDPMQAIYRFREAEVANFVLARNNGVDSIQLTPLYLTQNFRSDAGLVSGFNEIFKSVFASEESLETGDVAFSKADPFFKDDSLTQITADAIVTHKDRSIETQLVIDKVNDSLNDMDNPSIAILARSRGHLTEISEALTDAGIPFNSVEMQKLANRQVVLDVLYLARALCRLGDNSSWVSLLRQPVIGLSLKQIHQLVDLAAANKMLLSDLVLSMEHGLVTDPDISARLGPASSVLSMAIAKLSSYSLSLVMDELVIVLGYSQLECYSSSEDDIKTALSFIDGITDSNSLPTVDQIDMKLEQLYSTQLGGSHANVQLMTIHKSKGLQFDTVILPGMDRTSGRSDPHLLQWQTVYSDQTLEPMFLLAPLKPSSEKLDPTYNFLTKVGADLDHQELKRLCYVALTRAKKRLHMVYCLSPKGDTYSSPSTNSLLGISWQALEKLQKTTYVEQDVKDDFDNLTKPRLSPVVHQAFVARAGNSYLPMPNIVEDAESKLENLSNLQAKAFGTAVHLELELIAEFGCEQFTVDFINSRRPFYKSLLIESGAFSHGQALTASVNSFVEMITAATSKEHQWVFDNSRTLSDSEVEVQERIAGYVATHRIDRVVETNDFIAIVDYKTDKPLHSETDEDFIARAVASHSGQLARYSKFYASSHKPVKQYLFLLSINQNVQI